MAKISTDQIRQAKSETVYSDKPHHEHDDCIRIAYEWLDAQAKTKGQMRKTYPLKHIIEKWGGRYVSTTDVEVAAHLHPGIVGKYPLYNISSRLTLPRAERLRDIAEAHTQSSKKLDEKIYARTE